MNYYETLYIVHPALESGRLKDIIVSIQDSCKAMNVNILSTNVWGKKKLAYLIDKQKYGTYVLVQFSSDVAAISKIAQELEHNPNILLYITTKINESDIDKDLSSLDEQIGGSKSKGSEAIVNNSKSTSDSGNEEESITKDSSTEDNTPEETKENDEESNKDNESDTTNENNEVNHGTNE